MSNNGVGESELSHELSQTLVKKMVLGDEGSGHSGTSKQKFSKVREHVPTFKKMQRHICAPRFSEKKDIWHHTVMPIKIIYMYFLSETGLVQ